MKTKPTWAQMIRDMLDAGETQASIARAVGCHPATINLLLHGARGKRLTYEIAAALTAVHKRTMRRPVGKK